MAVGQPLVAEGIRDFGTDAIDHCISWTGTRRPTQILSHASLTMSLLREPSSTRLKTTRQRRSMACQVTTTQIDRSTLHLQALLISSLLLHPSTSALLVSSTSLTAASPTSRRALRRPECPAPLPPYLSRALTGAPSSHAPLLPAPPLSRYPTPLSRTFSHPSRAKRYSLSSR